MLEMLSASWDLLMGLFGSLLSVVVLVLVWGYEMLYHLHVSAPRLEGLLVGVLLTWLLLRREKHPVIRVASAPLKLVLDILDLAWDWCVEVVRDGWDAVTGVVSRTIGVVRNTIRSSASWVMSKLTALRDKLRKSE